jgi:hypothetical protein
MTDCSANCLKTTRRDNKMNTSSIKKSQRLATPSHRVITLDCGNLHNNDLIVMRTQNNLYKFLITDARSMRGRLTGEWRKSNFQEATLIGALIFISGQAHTLNARLQTAAQALFLVQHDKDLLQLTTSPIIALGWFINREE